MRKELEILAQIDDFLDGNITKEMLIQSLGNVEDLEAQIECQQILRATIQKEVFIIQSQKSLSKFKLIKAITIASVSIVIIGAIIGITLLLNRQAKETSKLQSDPLAKLELKETSKPPAKLELKEMPLFSDNLATIKQLKEDAKEKPVETEEGKNTLASEVVTDKKFTEIFWRGELSLNGQSFDFVFKLIKKDSIHYYAISKISNGKDYAVMKAKCRYENDVISFNEDEILEERNVSNKWCLKTGRLIFTRSKNGAQLWGSIWGKCGPGTFELWLVEDDKSLNIYNPKLP